MRGSGGGEPRKESEEAVEEGASPASDTARSARSLAPPGVAVLSGDTETEKETLEQRRRSGEGRAGATSAAGGAGAAVALPDSAELQGLSQLMGFDVALYAAITALLLLPMHPWNSDDRGRAQAFVLATVRLIPTTAGLSGRVGGELNLVSVIKRIMTPDLFGADFCASVLALWHSRAVADVLRSRGSLQGATAQVAALHAEFKARQKADQAKRGLRRCELPSCGKQEATVLQFRVCGHCQTTRYCCPEHAKQHWKAHKREYEAEEKEERGEAGDEGGAAA